MNRQTSISKQNTMCMCMTMCCPVFADPTMRDSNNTGMVSLRVRRLP